MQESKFRVVETSDGSSSLIDSVFEESYHSVAGARSESLHVYIKNGLDRVAQQSSNIRILEFGFGTGLNLLLTLESAAAKNLTIDYHTIELYPLPMNLVGQLNYHKFCREEHYSLFELAHKANFFEKIKLFDNFDIQKYHDTFLKYENYPTEIDLVYFDAFSYDTNPELWSFELFSRLFENMRSGAILVTYASKGVIKQNLRQAGFEVKRVEGALGKRHMVVATKP